MFGRRKQSEDEEEWDVDSFDENEDGMGSSGLALPKGLLIVLVFMVVIAIIAGLGFGATQLLNRRAPAYATEEWVEAMWNTDSETVLDRTCDQQIWVSNVLASGTSISGLMGYLDITQIPGLDQVVIPGVDLNGLKDEFEIDRSRIEFEEVMNDGQTAVVTAQGQLRFRVFDGWYPYRLNETWRVIVEDGRWKWCGRQP